MLAAIAVVEQVPAPQRITEEEARAIAAAEGLVLVPAPSSSTGYKGVTRSGSGGKPFKAQARQDGVKKNLGSYATAAEASLAYVRHVGPEACAEAWRATTAAEMGQADAAEAAVRQAEAEGLTLQPSANKVGYRGVRKGCRSQAGSKPFDASVWRAGINVHLGIFATAEEAALAYARTPEAQAQVANAKPAPLTAEEAVAQAAAEGLTLEPGNSTASYKGVNVQRFRYQATVRRAGKKVHLGCFVTAEEAALAYARTPEAQAQAANPRPAPSAPVTAEAAVAQAAAEGLTLERSSSAAGYKGVKLDRSRYQARVKRAGKDVYLGNFATAEDAALAYARTPAAQAQVAKRAPLTAEEAVAQAAAEGLKLLWRGGRRVGDRPEAQAQVANVKPPKPAPVTAEAAVAQAAAEGLTLERSSSAAGYKGVKLDRSRYQARVKRAGKDVYLGMFDTAEDAALAIARAARPAARHNI
eukprot:scaffold6576_cov65-Phaeocystis_antarctica.AAC.4